MVRDILDLHHVGGQGVRMSDETSGHWAVFGFVSHKAVLQKHGSRSEALSSSQVAV